MLLLTKNQFVKWLFVPIKNRILRIRFLVSANQSLLLISQMTALTNRCTLQYARNLFDRMRENSTVELNLDLISEIQSIINNEISNDIETYTSELCDFR